MTSIQPERLAKEVEEIRGLIMDPPRLRRRVVEMYDFFSDRTRRSRTSIRSKDVERKFGVPIPVMKALERGLKQSIKENSEYGPEVSEELWQVDYREPRLLAIALLDNCPLDAIFHRVEKWSQDTKDYELQARLAEILVIQWGRGGYRDFPKTITNWLKSKRLQRKLLSLLTMQFAVQDPVFEDIPQVFHLIRIHEISNDPQLRRAFHELLRSLIQRSSSETARYLLDVFEGQEQVGRRLVKELLPDFPSEEQIRLRHALSAR